MNEFEHETYALDNAVGAADLAEWNNPQALVTRARNIVDEAIDKLRPMDMHLARSLESAVNDMDWALESLREKGGAA